jgi:hypothetical protein
MKAQLRTDEHAKRLAQRLLNEYEVVVHPDHPLLFDSPDLLVAAPNNLVAIFILRAKELEASEALFARLAVTRLALPPNLRCVLLIPNERFSHIHSDVAQRHFHDVFTIEETDSLKSFIRDQNAVGRADRVPVKSKTQAFERFEVLFAESQKNLHLDELEYLPLSKSPRKSRPKRTEKKTPEVDAALTRSGDNPPPQMLEVTETPRLIKQMVNQFDFKSLLVEKWDYLNPYTNDMSKLSRRLIVKDDAVLGSIPKTLSTSISERIKPLCRDLLQFSYSLDNGVPYLRENTANLLITDAAPLKRFDPEKPVRAAAFAGWVVTRLRDIDEILNYTYRLRDVVGELGI